jgi:hypothetical protein
MRWLGAWFVVLAALWVGACSRDAPASDTVPAQDEEETLLATAAPPQRQIV